MLVLVNRDYLIKDNVTLIVFVWRVHWRTDFNA